MLDMKRQTKDALYEQFSRATKALSSPKRIEILELLGQSEKTVETIADQAHLGLKNASAQLKELRSALLVDSRRDGKYVYYRIANAAVASFLLGIRTFGETHFAEIQKIAADAFDESESMEPINRKHLLARARKGDVILLDVRPRDEYDHAHLPFAVSVPVSDLRNELKNLPKNKEIVAYCRGPYCFFAKEAVELLKKNGFKASRLKDSVHEWASNGLPVETQASV